MTANTKRFGNPLMNSCYMRKNDISSLCCIHAAVPVRVPFPSQGSVDRSMEITQFADIVQFRVVADTPGHISGLVCLFRLV